MEVLIYQLLFIVILAGINYWAYFSIGSIMRNKYPDLMKEIGAPGLWKGGKKSLFQWKLFILFNKAKFPATKELNIRRGFYRSTSLLLFILGIILWLSILNVPFFFNRNTALNFANKYIALFSPVDSDRGIDQCPEKKTLEKQFTCYQSFVLSKSINTTYVEGIYIKDKDADNYPDECAKLKDSKNKIYCRAAVAVTLRDPRYCIKESIETGIDCLMIYSGKLNAPEACDLIGDSYGKLKDYCRTGNYLE